MNKLLFILIINIAGNVFALDTIRKMSSSAVTTAYDKIDPEAVLLELKQKGVSKDKRVQMTQMHRIDRIIPFLIDKNDEEKLCRTMGTIITEDYPLSDIAKHMACDYLWKARPSIQSNKQALNRINEALDLLNPAQIIEDLQKGQTYSVETVEIENRVNRSLERLVKLGDTNSLIQLVNLIENLSKNKTQLVSKNATTKILPGQRVMQSAYEFLRSQEKQTKQSKNYLIKTFKTKKNDSDTEEDSKNKQH